MVERKYASWLVCLFYTNYPSVWVSKTLVFRDDGLAILENASGATSECIKKKIIKVFHQLGLKITTETNLVQTNFLYVTFNLPKIIMVVVKPNLKLATTTIIRALHNNATEQKLVSAKI